MLQLVTQFYNYFVLQYLEFKFSFSLRSQGNAAAAPSYSAW